MYSRVICGKRNMPNRLANESSPYLLQHANNPVNWYPWGEEALTLAKNQDKPILISVGYAACHWCHVMEHESFEDARIAAFMNEHFVNIKVDREERPDLDQIYMSAVQAMTGQGGWPMNVFLTPTGEPFYGGTYYPPTPRYGMASWGQVLTGIANAWQTRRNDITKQADEMAGHIQQEFVLKNQSYVLNPLLFERAEKQFDAQFDRSRGGFGGAPKFPPSMSLEFLLRIGSLEMVTTTLDQMAWGGMYDHIGGGFARYSVDARWLVPHFEKMLYDNAQLARIYLHAYQVTGNIHYRQVAEETLDWTLREMTEKNGGFYSSLDADSEGVEGKFYVWSRSEIEEILGNDAPLFMARYDVTTRGNWEGHNILNTTNSELADVAARFNLSPEAAETKLVVARQKLFDVRAMRVWPGLDDKVLTAWNGLMMAAFAEAGRVLKRDDYLVAASKNAEFLHATMRTANGRLLRTWKAGNAAKYNAYLEDYAYLADGLIALYQATFDVRWFTWAHELTSQMMTHFKDEENGGFFDTSDDHEKLLYRPKSLQDNATPSANAMACRVLILMNLFTGDGELIDYAEEMVAALYPALAQYPNGFAHWLGCAWLLLSEPQEVALIGENVAALADVIWEEFRPNVVVAAGNGDTPPLLSNRVQIENRPTAYVCQNFVCQLPVTTASQLRVQLQGLNFHKR